MRRLFAVLVPLCLSVATAAHAQTVALGVGPGGSPHVRSDYVVAGAKISVAYGRPSLKGRAEGDLMPAGKPWRTGADQATLLTTDKPLAFGTLKLPAGTYTLNTQPGASQWELLVGNLKQPDQWGIPYAPDLERGRAPMTLAHVATKVEQLTINVESNATGGVLRVEWGTVRATIPFTVER